MAKNGHKLSQILDKISQPLIGIPFWKAIGKANKIVEEYQGKKV